MSLKPGIICVLRVILLCAIAYGFGATPIAGNLPDPLGETFRVWTSAINRAATMGLADHGQELASHALKQAALIGQVIGPGTPAPKLPDLPEGWHYHVEM